MSRITQQELESNFWRTAVVLRGLIDAGDYKQFILPNPSNDFMTPLSQC